MSAANVFAAEPLAKVEGEISKELKEAILLALGEVEDAPRSAAQARRRGAKAKETALSVLRSQGYYGASVNVVIPRSTEDEKGKASSRRPRLTVKPGRQFLFGPVDIVYEGPQPDLHAGMVSVLPVKTGNPARAQEVITSEAGIVSTLRQNGYPKAVALKRKAVVDHADTSLSVTFDIETKDKTRFGEIIVTGDAKVSEKWARRVSPTKAGELADIRELNQFASRVIATQAFGGSSATLSDDSTPNADGTITRDVILDVKSGKRNTVSAEVGVSTTDGTGAEIIYTRRNVGHRGQTLKVDGTVKTNLLSLGVDYHIPYWRRVDRSLDLGIEVAREDTDAFTGERVTTKALVSQQVTEHFEVSAGIGLEISQFEEENLGRRAYLLEGLSSAKYDRRNSILDPSKGYLLELNADPTYNFGGSNGLFTTVETSGSVYRRVSEKFVLAGRAKVGTIVGASTDVIPLNRRFYGGGGGSVRGFGFQTISPEDEDGTLIGGRSIAETSAEIRYHGDSPLGFVGFVDAGSVNSRDWPDFEDVRVGAGVGVRYFTSFAPIRADIAIPVNKRDGDSNFQVYISIGQAF